MDVGPLTLALEERKGKCFLCRWILEDLSANGRLTRLHPPPCSDQSDVFPVSGKVAHLKLEGFWSDGLAPLAEKTGDKK